jgi:hypothetical protein
MEQTSPALEQWQRLMQPLREGKHPSSSSKVTREYASALEGVLPESTDQIMPDLDLLPAGVVGRAYGAACTRMAPERAQKILDWISSREHGRADNERAHALPGLMDSAPGVAFRLLCGMRGSPIKQQRERLASVLAGVTAASVAQTLAGQEKEYELRKAVELLLIAAQQPKADSNMRKAIVEGVVPSIKGARLDSGSIGAEVHKGMEAVLEMLDAASAAHVRGLLEQGATKRRGEETPTGPVPAAPTGQPATPSGDSAPPATAGISAQGYGERPTPPSRAVLNAPRSDTAHEPPPPAVPAEQPGLKPDPLAWFDANIQMLTHARDSYLAVRRAAEAARAEAEAERKRREEAEAKIADSAHLVERLSQAEIQNRKLEEQVSEAERERDFAKSESAKAATDLSAERELRESKECELQEALSSFAQERENLQRRIAVNAEARLRDFRIEVSSALDPLLRDVPKASPGPTTGLAEFLLVCIDQIVRALAEKGVELRRSAGGGA